MAWGRLKTKHAPKTSPPLLKLKEKEKFVNSKLEDLDRNPDEFITELEGLQSDMEDIHITTTMSDLDFMILVLNNLPEPYDVVLDDMASRLMLEESDDNYSTSEDVKVKLSNGYEQLDDRKHKKNIMRNNVDLYAGGPSQYKGSCNKCGKYSHKGTEFPEVTGNGFVCWYCGKPGHTKRLFGKWKAACGQREMAGVAFEEYSGNESIVELAF